jgi:hypothetical protein
MNNQAMQVGSFLNFGLENAKKHWLKFIGLSILGVIAVLVAAGIFFGISAALPEAVTGFGTFVASLAVAVVAITVMFGFFKNVLNLCRGQAIDLMAFLHVKPATIINFIIANLLMSVVIAVGLLFLIIPGVILSCMLMYVPYLIIDREMGFVEAFKESAKISKGHIMDVLVGFYLSAGVAGYLSTLVITIVFTIPMIAFVYAYPYLVLTGQLDEVQNKLAEPVAGPVTEPVAGADS